MFDRYRTRELVEELVEWMNESIIYNTTSRQKYNFFPYNRIFLLLSGTTQLK